MIPLAPIYTRMCKYPHWAFLEEDDEAREAR